jgi:hypothetical protein
MSPLSFRLSFETASTTSPSSTVELFHSGSSRVEETTYLDTHPQAVDVRQEHYLHARKLRCHIRER